jgi:hypothetical protein
MDTEIACIVAAILHVSRKSGDLRTRDPIASAEAIRVACAEWEATEKELVTPDLKEAPGWTGYEMKVFNLGRALDLVMRKMNVWRGKGEVLDACAAVLAEPRYGRGRQSYAVVLGEHGQSAYGTELVSMLADEVMAGYAIKAMTQGGYGTYVEEVRAFSDNTRPWVRNAARAYVTKFTAARRARDPRSAAM